MLVHAHNQFLSLFGSETIQKSRIFLQNSDKNKFWMLHYLLYIIIHKGIPAMGCLDVWLEIREGGFYDREDEGRGGSGRDCTGLCYRELCLQCCLLIAAFPTGQSVTRWPPGKNRTNPLGWVSPWGRSPNFVVPNGGIRALCFWWITIWVPKL